MQWERGVKAREQVQVRAKNRQRAAKTGGLERGPRSSLIVHNQVVVPVGRGVHGARFSVSTSPLRPPGSRLWLN
ncbi:hypothetical protein ACWCPJ_38970 [Streptomyces collinus]